MGIFLFGGAPLHMYTFALLHCLYILYMCCAIKVPCTANQALNMCLKCGMVHVLKLILVEMCTGEYIGIYLRDTVNVELFDLINVLFMNCRYI